jgi:eukaryotic-like serine/threonine-protein kinase
LIAGRYTFEREIGRGGMGAVWLGRDEVLGRTVALKRIGMPPGQTDPDTLRAEREARLGARVNHPNVVAVFDLVETPDGHWLVMEYVAGANLARAIEQRGPMPPDTAAPLLARVADALAAAHEAGIVHRDVKPSNILLGDDGGVKLSDFGIARGLADASLTQTGLVTGSPAYLSPEVASGSSATPASDVWSLGATMFHALGGRPPYDVGDNVLGAMYRIVHEEPPRLRSAGPLAPLLEMTMTREPADRPTMAEVRDYLRAGPGSLPGEGPSAEGTPADETAVMATIPPPPPPRPDPTTVAPIVPPDAVAAGGAAERDRKVGLLAVGGGVLAVLAVIGVILLVGTRAGDDEPTASDDGAGGSAQPSDGGSPTPSEPTDEGTTEEPAAPTAQQLETFARDYVATAIEDPAAGFDQLTPDYQARSPDYAEFWGAVSNPRFRDVSGDPEAMQVTYTYQYDLAGQGSKVERVTLSLVRDGDGFLIAGASGQPVRG